MLSLLAELDVVVPASGFRATLHRVQLALLAELDVVITASGVHSGQRGENQQKCVEHDEA